jgi:glutamine amidotransferase
MIGIVDYGIGNIQAIANIYKKLNIAAAPVREADALRAADKLILPGVGSFDWAMQRLNDSGMRAALDELVGAGKPVLGICVGMQMMADRSDEGQLPGLGWLPGEVKRFDASAMHDRMRLPHMGWNDVLPRERSGLFAGLESPIRFYFLHSYYFAAQRPEDVLAEADYNGLFACAVGRGHAYGVQFHPEKSHGWGVQLLKNFAEVG